MARIERESDRKREEKWQTCWCCRDQQRPCRMARASTEKLEHTGPAEKEWKIRPHLVSERKRKQQQRKEKETSIPLQKDSESRSKK